MGNLPKRKERQNDKARVPLEQLATLVRGAPLGKPGDGCQITFGHNATDRKVLMAFSVATATLIFDPEDARGIARSLLHYADMADGRKTQG